MAIVQHEHRGPVRVNFQELFDDLPGVVCQIYSVVATSLQFTVVSAGCQSVFEIAPEVVLQDADAIHSLIHPDDRLSFEQSFQHSTQTLKPWYWQGRCCLPSGQTKWIEANFQLEQVEDGICWNGMFLEITRYKRSELLQERLAQKIESPHLEQAETERDRFFVRSADMFCMADFNGYFKRLNSAFERALGYVNGELYALPFIDFVHPDDRAETLRQATKLGQGEQIISFENRYRCKDGSYRWLSWVAAPYLEEQLIYASVRDITTQKQLEADRRQAELNLQKERKFLNAMLDNLADGIVACDETGQLTLFNRATREFHGLPEQPLPPDQWASHFDLFCADGQTQMPMEEVPLFRAFMGELVKNVEMVIAPKHGKRRVVLASGQAFFDQNGHKLGAVVVMHDITDRRQAELALQNALQNEVAYQSQLLQAMSESSADWIFAKDTAFRYILVNRSFADAIGKPQAEILGKTDLELGFPDELVFGNPEKGIRGFRTDDCEAMAGCTVSNSYDPVVVADGSLRVFDTQKMPLYGTDGDVFAVLGIARDMTERYKVEDALKHSETQLREKAQQLEQTLRELQQTQSQLIQNEKMSSLGQLVAGVAHEINNPVNFIYGNLTHADEYARGLLRLLTLYQRHYPHPIPSIQSEADAIDLEFMMADLPKLMESMRIGANRIQKIVASLRVFSRMDEAEMKAVDIHEGIDSTLMILQNRLKARSHYPEIEVMKFYGELPFVECFPGQLNQVFMNILSNAIDALEEAFEKDSSFSPCIQIWTEYTSQNRIKIRIIDNGLGIPTAVQQQIFDPFFTTKPVGKGTGLGMSISYQIITERHKGSLTCHSQPGQGTEFAIEIPVWQ
jgi:two-component system NtrC family sensor kinase